jgi:hypothetical protein
MTDASLGGFILESMDERFRRARYLFVISVTPFSVQRESLSL